MSKLSLRNNAKFCSIISILLGLTIIHTHVMPTTSSPTTTTSKYIDASCIDKMNPQDNGFEFLHDLRKKYEHQPVFLQSVKEIALSLGPLFQDPENGEFYKRAFTAMTEPERTISFRVPWEDDEGNMRFNRGWRVEFSR